MSLLPEYHAVLNCPQPVDRVERSLSRMPLSVSGKAYKRRNADTSAHRFVFSWHIPYTYSTRYKQIPSFLPTVDISVIPGAEQTQVRILFQLEDIVLLLMIIIYGFSLVIALIGLLISFISDTVCSFLLFLLSFLIALILFHCLGAHALRKGSVRLLAQISAYLGIYPTPELKKGSSFEA